MELLRQQKEQQWHQKQRDSADGHKIVINYNSFINDVDGDELLMIITIEKNNNRRSEQTLWHPQSRSDQINDLAFSAGAFSLQSDMPPPSKSIRSDSN